MSATTRASATSAASRASNFSSRMTMANSTLWAQCNAISTLPATPGGPFLSFVQKRECTGSLSSSCPSYHIFFASGATSLSLSVKRPIRSPGKFCSSQSYTPTSSKASGSSSSCRCRSRKYMGWSHFGACEFSLTFVLCTLVWV